MALQDIGLSLLKHISSHRGLTYVSQTNKTYTHPVLTLNRHELFDEYTRRQFAAKMPNRKNPFGNDEVAARFADFDLFKKVCLLLPPKPRCPHPQRLTLCSQYSFEFCGR